MPKLWVKMHKELEEEVAKNRSLIIDLVEELNRHKATIRIINDAVLDLGLRNHGMSLVEYDNPQIDD